MYVMADTITKPEDDSPLNEVSLDGIIEEKQLRETPLGRKICDVKLKTIRENGKEDLITCIAWSDNAEYTNTLSIGDRLAFTADYRAGDTRKRVKMVTLWKSYI